MLYGFGDSFNQYKETINLINDIVNSFMISVVNKCVHINPTKLSVHTLIYVLRSHSNMVNRVEELLKSNEEINAARKQRLNDEKKWFT